MESFGQIELVSALSLGAALAPFAWFFVAFIEQFGRRRDEPRLLHGDTSIVTDQDDQPEADLARFSEPA